jgi:arginine N-succinyltransferase
MSEILIQTEPGGERLALADDSASLLLVPHLGMKLPRYHFHVGRVVHASGELDLFRVQTTLLLGNDLTGQSELTEFSASVRLDAAAQSAAFSKLIEAAQSRVRASPGQFGEWLVAELPGWLDAAGTSPFWRALGARFFEGDPIDTERRLGAGWRSHFAALLPRQTVYLSFLGEAAEAALGRPSDDVQPVLHALKGAGFERSAEVRIDDAGPVLSWRVPRL